MKKYSREEIKIWVKISRQKMKDYKKQKKQRRLDIAQGFVDKVDRELSERLDFLLSKRIIPGRET